VAVHRHAQRAEVADAEPPQRLGVQVVQVDVLDLLDPGGFQRGGAADDGQVGAAQVGEGLRRAVAQAALADDQSHALALHQRPREAFHPIGRGGADAHRRVARGMLGAGRHLAHVGRGVDHGMAAQVQPRAAAVEHVDLRRVANAVERALQRHGVVDAQRAHLRLGDRHLQFVVGHRSGAPVRSRCSRPTA
jgi:hypothetical protein